MESKRSKNTKLLFCTTGVILRRLQDDHELKSITHVIVDEVHERQVQTDVLLIALRQLLRTTRRDLKVILVRFCFCFLICSHCIALKILTIHACTFLSLPVPTRLLMLILMKLFCSVHNRCLQLWTRLCFQTSLIMHQS
jgi:hypothetical protein